MPTCVCRLCLFRSYPFDSEVSLIGLEVTSQLRLASKQGPAQLPSADRNVLGFNVVPVTQILMCVWQMNYHPTQHMQISVHIHPAL